MHQNYDLKDDSARFMVRECFPQVWCIVTCAKKSAQCCLRTTYGALPMSGSRKTLVIGNEDYFCAGWRLDVLDGIGADERRRFTDLALKLMPRIYDYPKPTVAAVAGVAPGYGMDVPNMCDVAIASENAAFGSTQVKYAMNGFYHGLVSRVGAQRARRMLFTGDPIDSARPCRVLPE